jgi:hypothetical protein
LESTDVFVCIFYWESESHEACIGLNTPAVKWNWEEEVPGKFQAPLASFYTFLV